jgi:hypothetical protein
MQHETATINAPRQLSCSFCGKVPTEVKKLVVGPAVNICSECIEVCNYSIGNAIGNIFEIEPDALYTACPHCGRLEEIDEGVVQPATNYVIFDDGRVAYDHILYCECRCGAQWRIGWTFHDEPADLEHFE